MSWSAINRSVRIKNCLVHRILPTLAVRFPVMVRKSSVWFHRDSSFQSCKAGSSATASLFSPALLMEQGELMV